MMLLPILSAMGAALFIYLGYLLRRFPHLRRLAWRSIRSQRRSTVLTIIGLGISTALISMTLITITSLSRAAEQDLRQLYGSIAYDISSRNQPAANSSLFTRQTIQDIRQEVDGEVLPVVSMPATSMTKDGQGKIDRLFPHVHVIGVDAAEAGRFDPSLIDSLGGGPQRDEVLLSSRAAAALKARSGDEIYVVDAANQERALRVSGIVQERGLTGYPGVFQAGGTAIVALDTARALAGIDGPHYTNLLLTSEPFFEWKGTPVREIYATERESGIEFFSVFFGMVSLNVIFIGIVLATNIFRIIAEERRAELGILRSIGLGKSDVRRLLMVEGLLYGLFAGIIGVAAGWLLAFIFLDKITAAFHGFIVLDVKSLLMVNPYAPLSGLALGLLIVFICVLFIAGKAVKLSIVDTMKPASDLHPRLKRDNVRHTWLLILSCLLLMLIFILFAVPEIRREWIIDAQLPLIIAVIFLSTPLLALIAARLLPAISRGILYMFRHMAAASLVIRLAFRNLNASPLRTGLILFMFAAISYFICFTLLYGNSIGQYMKNQNPLELTGGHEWVARDWRPLLSESIVQRLSASDEHDQSLDAFRIAAVQQLTWKNGWGPWGQIQFKVNGIDPLFAESNDIPLRLRDSNYASDREAWRELARNNEVVILARDIRFHTGAKLYDVGDSFPITIGDRTVTKLVIGIAEQSGYHPESYGIWINQSVMGELAKSEQEIHSTVFIKPGGDADRESAERLKRLLALQNIYPLTNIIESESEYYHNTIVISNLLQAFNMAALGIAMIGLIVVMYRLIRQRSRQVGVLRAIGIRSKTVQLSLLLEGFILGSLGIILGFAAGTFGGYTAFNTIFESTEPTSLSIPLLEILGYFCTVLALSFVITYVPARHALSILPTEATRISN